jgi:hypothetical protein
VSRNPPGVESTNLILSREQSTSPAPSGLFRDFSHSLVSGSALVWLAIVAAPRALAAAGVYVTTSNAGVGSRRQCLFEWCATLILECRSGEFATEVYDLVPYFLYPIKDGLVRTLPLVNLLREFDPFKGFHRAQKDSRLRYKATGVLGEMPRFASKRFSPLSHSESGRVPIRICARLSIELRNCTSATRFLSGCPRASRITITWPLVAQSKPHFGGRSFSWIKSGGHK